MASQLPYQLRPSARNQTSISATAANSQNHSITALAPIESKATTARPDLTLYRFGMKFRAAECGKEDEVGIGKKKIVESNLHCPKILKAVLLFIGKKCDNNLMVLQSSKIIGFTQFHLRMRMHLLDNPNGFVCGIQLTEQYEIPTTPSLMSAGLFQILKITSKSKKTVQNLIKDVRPSPTVVDIVVVMSNLAASLTPSSRSGSCYNGV